MDFLATPHLWTLYEAPVRSVQWDPSRLLTLALSRRAGMVLSGAILLSLMGPQLHARNFSSAGTAYIAPPPGYNVNIRSGPGTQFTAVNTLAPGTAITLNGVYSRGWAQLTNGNWVAGNLINSSDRGIVRGSAATAIVTPPVGYNANVRSGPGTQFTAVNTLAPGTLISTTGQYRNGWAQLTSGNWISEDLIRIREFTRDPQISDGQVGLLRVGSRSPEVIRLERRLRELGYVTSDFIPNEYYGPDTAQAVRNFQQRNSLFIDGVAGSATRRTLYSANAIPRTLSQPAPPEQSSVLRVGSRSPSVIALEQRLKELDYVTSDFIPDEFYGTDTAQAVENFQQRNGLFIDGIFGSATRQALYGANAIPRVTAQETPRQPAPPSSNPDPSPDSDSPTQGSSQGARVATSNGSDALIFSGPGTEFDIVGYAANGDLVSLTGRTQDNWSELADGNWIYSDHIGL